MEAWTEGKMRAAATRLYRPLKSWQTRLLRLQPGAVADILLADLVVAGLAQNDGAITSMNEEPISYEATSYCWGAIDLSAPIIINSIEYRVNMALANALRQFRREDDVRYLWADALCINQYDNLERSQQVLNIHSVFRKASHVLVWLGNAGTHTSAAIAASTSPGNSEKQTSESYQRADVDAALASIVPHRTLLSALRAGASSNPSSEKVIWTKDQRAGMADLCCRPWARRVWVQQEVYFAREITIFCGPDSMSLTTYQKISRDFEKCVTDTVLSRWGSIDRVIYNMKKTIQAVKRLVVASHASLVSLELERVGVAFQNIHSGARNVQWLASSPERVLNRCQHLMATDARDYIYALLGLTCCQTSAAGMPDKVEGRSRTTLVILVDYDLSVSQVFQQVTRYIINRDRGLHYLEREEHRRSLRPDFGIPSWAIDWTAAKPARGASVTDPSPTVEEQRGSINFVDPTGGQIVGLEQQTHDHDGTIHLIGTILGAFSRIDRGSPPEMHASNANFEMTSYVQATYHDYGHVLIHEPEEMQAEYDSRNSWRFDWREDSYHPDDCIAVGDIIAQVDGLQHSCICLRSCPDGLGSFTFVCICRDEGILNLLAPETGVAKYRHYRTVVLPPASRREFVVC